MKAIYRTFNELYHKAMNNESFMVPTLTPAEQQGIIHIAYEVMEQAYESYEYMLIDAAYRDKITTAIKQVINRIGEKP